MKQLREFCECYVPPVFAIVVLIIMLACLTGCATTQPATTIKVPVPIACQESIPDRPAMPTEQFTARPKLDEFTKAAQAELERREGYEGRLRTALEACTKPLT